MCIRDRPYTVYFGGVVDGYTFPEETYDFTIVKRMLPDGVYAWEIRAETDDGEIATATGTLTIQDLSLIHISEPTRPY